MEKAFISLADVSEDHHLYVGYDDYLRASSFASYGYRKLRPNIDTLSIFRLIIIVDLCFSSLIC